MPFARSKIVSVTTAASVELVPADPQRVALYIANETGNQLRVGGSDVTLAATPATAGYRVQSNEEMSVVQGERASIAPKVAFHAQFETADGNVSVLEIVED